MTMPKPSYTRLIMLGTAFETRGGIAAVVNVYRAQGLFERWPIDYVATHCDGGAARKLLTAVRALLKVVFLLIRHRRVVMHVHCASRASFWRKSLFMALGMLANCPFIVHLHGAEFVRFYEAECGEVKRRMIRYFLDRAACVIALSAWWQTWISGVTQNPRLACIANPAPTLDERAAVRRERVVLFLGRLDQRKGIFDLLEGVRALRASIPGIRLVCAGDGDLESVEQYAKRLGIADAVSVPGWIRPAEKRSLMNRAAVFVLPSYAEGLPMSLLEAMAAGLPVVATEVGGIPDVVTHGVNGFLFRPGDIATLERLLRGLMRDAQLSLRIGTAARETVRLRFSADQVCAQLDEIYAGLGLAHSGARTGTPASLIGASRG
jgi:glycosyltransferase involved in cell wall biosynthesis